MGSLSHHFCRQALGQPVATKHDITSLRLSKWTIVTRQAFLPNSELHLNPLSAQSNHSPLSRFLPLPVYHSQICSANKSLNSPESITRRSRDLSQCLPLELLKEILELLDQVVSPQRTFYLKPGLCFSSTLSFHDAEVLQRCPGS